MRAKALEGSTRGRMSVWSGLTVTGVAAVVLLLTGAASAGGVHPTTFGGATFAPSYSTGVSGCGKLTSAPPTWSKKTGDGNFAANASSPPCASTVKGVAVASSASASADSLVYAPVKLPTGVGGINVTWTLNAAWLVHITQGVASGCPGSSSSYGYYYSYLNTWINYTDSYSSCSADASIDVYGSAMVLDVTNGSSYYSDNYWYGFYQQDSWSYSTYLYTTNYSNSSQWQNNYTSYDTYGYLNGANGHGTMLLAPTWFINGTFVSGHKYVIETSFQVSVDSNAVALKGASAVAALKAAPGTKDEALTYTVW